VICLVLKHPFWGNISFPIACELHLRQETIDKFKGDKICMNLRASHKQGWQETECQLYGKRVMKTYKTFTAVSKMTAYKPVRILIVQEANGWIPLLSTDTSLSAQETIERYGVCFGIGEVFKGLKEVWRGASRKFGS
jgi:hypothetical protein